MIINMSISDLKKSAFEYLLNGLLEWFSNVTLYKNSSSFSRVKVLKLLFFVAAIKDSKGNDLLDIFDKFYAMPHGPVESDIYNYMSRDELKYYSFNEIYLKPKQVYSVNSENLPLEIRTRIDNAIKCLRLENPLIINKGAFELVEISHKWIVWKNSMKIAELGGKSSSLMLVESIRSNPPIFM